MCPDRHHGATITSEKVLPLLMKSVARADVTVPLFKVDHAVADAAFIVAGQRPRNPNRSCNERL